MDNRTKAQLIKENEELKRLLEREQQHIAYLQDKLSEAKRSA